MPEHQSELFIHVEETLIQSVEWLRIVVEAIGVLVIALGIVVATWQFVQVLIIRRSADFAQARFTLARYLALALEFQLGADILSTAVAPTWEAIGRLAAIAVIRTGLNFFLMREMKEQQEAIERRYAAETKS